MSEELIRYFAAQGPFALLFILLLWWVLKEGARREERLISSLDRITERLDKMGQRTDERLNAMGTEMAMLRQDVSEIRERVYQG